MKSMKPRYIELITQQADPDVHPRSHLRWMELDENGLKLGFSSESVFLKGANLDLLMRDLVTGKTEVVQARPKRDDVPDEWSVHSIIVPEKVTAKPPPTSSDKQ